uniref:Uncharacterized protein n=1 Tax=Pristionchus pacificus TaxID=54126 RepID=A0A2A6BX21_PRIPA|eukprot:PDM70445.1 hypothetical protein PRIPAC_46691 [Pristionchus pacificus]
MGKLGAAAVAMPNVLHRSAERKRPCEITPAMALMISWNRPKPTHSMASSTVYVEVVETLVVV